MLSFTLWFPLVLLGIHLGQLSIDFSFDHYSLEWNKEMIPIIHQYYLKLHQQPFPYTLFITTPGFLLSALLSYRIFKKRHKEDILTLVSYLILAVLYQFVVWTREELQTAKTDLIQLHLLQRIAYLHVGIAILCLIGIIFQIRLLSKWKQTITNIQHQKSKTN